MPAGGSRGRPAGTVAPQSELNPLGQLERRDEPSELLLLLGIEMVRLGFRATHLEILEVRSKRLLDAVADLSHAPHPLLSLVFADVIVCSRSVTYAWTLMRAWATIWPTR